MHKILRTTIITERPSSSEVDGQQNKSKKDTSRICKDPQEKTS